jgi:hypothetical protein
LLVYYPASDIRSALLGRSPARQCAEQQPQNADDEGPAHSLTSSKVADKDESDASGECAAF